MPHIAPVVADAFVRPMRTGRTQPFLFSCLDADGQQAEFVVKLHGQLNSGVLNEYWCARLGDLLELPLSTTAVVFVDERLGLLHEQLSAALMQQPGPHFGSKHIGPQMIEFAGSLNDEDFLVGVEIFAFDYLIQNADRRMLNPNLYIANDRFWMIDHEMALGFDRILGGYQMPWLLPVNVMWPDHVMFRSLKGNVADSHLDGFIQRLASLDTGSLERIAKDIPASWNYDRLNSLVAEYLSQVLNDLPRFRRGLMEVLA